MDPQTIQELYQLMTARKPPPPGPVPMNQLPQLPPVPSIAPHNPNPPGGPMQLGPMPPLPPGPLMDVPEQSPWIPTAGGGMEMTQKVPVPRSDPRREMGYSHSLPPPEEGQDVMPETYEQADLTPPDLPGDQTGINRKDIVDPDALRAALGLPPMKFPALGVMDMWDLGNWAGSMGPKERGPY